MIMKTKISKIDNLMLDAAKLIHDNLNDDGICTSLTNYDINAGAPKSLTGRLANKGYIEIVKHPTRNRQAFRWVNGGLRPYQIYMRNLALTAKEPFIIMGMPTGTGKTRLALNLIQQFDTSMFITPRINLSMQTHSVFGEALDEVGLLQGSNSSNLSAPHIVANLQTLESRIKKAGDVELPYYDCVIFDEIHYSYDRIKQLIPKLNCGRVIGLTGTPFQSDGTPLEGARIIEPFDINWFIEQGYLSKLKCMQSVLIDDCKLKKSTGESGFTQNSVDEITRDDIFNQGIISATKNKIIGQTIVFAASIIHCEKLAEGYRDAGFKVLTMHSNLDDSLEQLAKFKAGEAQLLITVNMVSFGTDVPEVITAVIARPIGSKSLYRQIVGRILRTAPDKTEALLLDCGGNIRRLGHPLARVQPPEEREYKSEPKCAECEHPKAPYLFSFKQDFDLITRIYKCAVCGAITEAEKELGTVKCDDCDRYHLSSSTTLRGNTEILKCDCGCVTVIKTLDDLDMVLDDESLLELKLKHYVSSSSPENLLPAVSNTALIINSVKTEMYELPTVLLMIEKGGIEKTSNLIEAKQTVNARRAAKVLENKRAKEQAAHDAELIANAKKLIEPAKSGVRVSLEGYSADFIRKGLGGLDSMEVEAIEIEYRRSSKPLAQLNKILKSRISNIENSGKPLSELVGFISYIEEPHRSSAAH